MKLFRLYRNCGGLVYSLISCLCISIAHAGSFSLYTESNGTAVGNFAAGIAAEAVDASTAWYNPAGLALIHAKQLIVSGVGVLPSTYLSGDTLFATTGVDSYQQSFQNLQGAENNVIPAVYLAMPIGPDTSVAFSVLIPFGLSTNWPENSPLRYAGTYSKLINVDMSPAIGGKIGQHWALGLGLDFQYAQVDFDSVAGAPAQLQALGLDPQLWDSYSANHGSSFGLAFHAGILGLWNNNHTRIGFNYQSAARHQFNGTSTLTGYLASDGITDPDAVFSTNLSSNDLEFPAIATLSSYHDLNDKVAILASIVWSDWQSFQTIQLNHVAGLYPNAIDVTSTEGYHNAWRAALGFNYRYNEKLLLRTGGGYDQTPTTNIDRSIRIPDADRWAIAFGAHYLIIPALSCDLGVTYLHTITETTVHKTIESGPDSTFTVNATGQSYAYLVGGQLTWLF